MLHFVFIWRVNDHYRFQNKYTLETILYLQRQHVLSPRAHVPILVPLRLSQSLASLRQVPSSPEMPLHGEFWYRIIVMRSPRIIMVFH